MPNDRTRPRGERLDPLEEAFNRYVDAMLEPHPTRARTVLHKPRIPRGEPTKL